MHYPKLTICSPAFFNKERYSLAYIYIYIQIHIDIDTMYIMYIFLFSRLIQYELDDENDDVANYIILSLQFDPMIPGIEVNILL